MDHRRATRAVGSAVISTNIADRIPHSAWHGARCTHARCPGFSQAVPRIGIRTVQTALRTWVVHRTRGASSAPPTARPEKGAAVNARPWTPESRDALLTRVTALTAGTAVAGAVGAVGLGAVFAVTTHPKTVTRTATRTSAAAPTGSSAATKSRTLAPSQVRVQVLNGLGVTGAARAVGDQLTAAGFDVVGVGNAPGGIVSASVIVYPPGETDAARLLAGATGVNAVSPSGAGSVLTLVIGPDWTGTLPNQSSSSQSNVAPAPAPQQASSSGSVVVSGGS